MIELLGRPLELTLGDRDRHGSERVDLRLGRLHLDACRRERVEVGFDSRELRPHVRGLRDERLDDSLVGDRRQLAVEATAALGHEVHESPAALA